MHDICISKNSGKITVSHHKLCFTDEYTLLSNYKPSHVQYLSDPLPYEPIILSDEKLRQLSDQHKKYIK